MWRILCLFFLVIGSKAAKCRALALGGGNDYGAYQAGVLVGLINNLPPGEA